MVLWIFQLLSASHEVLWPFLSHCVGNSSLRYVGVEIFPDLVLGNICGVLSVENCLGSGMCCHEPLLLRRRAVDDDFGVSSWAPLG